MYVSAVTFAEKTIHLTAADFVPDDQMLNALVDAAKRGVDVKIVLPKASDSSLALYAGQYYYDELLEAGVKLYERRNALLHAKTAVIDGVWSTVGSTNLDFWSFSENFESKHCYSRQQIRRRNGKDVCWRSGRVGPDYGRTVGQ